MFTGSARSLDFTVANSLLVIFSDVIDCFGEFVLLSFVGRLLPIELPDTGVPAAWMRP